MRLLSLALSVAVALAAAPAWAQQDDDLFVKKPYVWKEDEKDRRLLNTKLMKSMATGFKNPHCARVAGSLLAAFAEAAPYFHKKDNRFALFTVFTAPIETDKFPASDYLTHMLHRAMIDGKAPEAWLAAGKAIKAKHKVPIDLARLAYAVDGPTLIDAIDFGFATFLEHYQRQVLLAPSVALASALERFEDRYLDRDFAWPGMVLADIHREDPPPKKKGRKVVLDEEEGPKYIATLLVPQQRPANDSYFAPTRIPEPMRLVVTLAPEQYIDLKKVVISQKYLVHGRFYGFKPGKPGQPPMTVDVREGLIFEDHDWTNYAGFADASDVEQCDLAINDLSPLGLKDHQGVGARDGFAH